jgi:4-azaleucine resistance transporter AzlC
MRRKMADMMTKRAEFLAGIKNTLPILLGVLPFGLIYGASAQQAHMPSSVAQAMSSIVFAGSAQFVIVQLIAAGVVPAGIIILTATIINLRHMLYSASLAPYLKQLSPFWQMLLAYLLTDEVYAVAITHYQQRSKSHYQHWYFLGGGLALWTIWQASTAVGILLGAHIPASWSLDFALPLTFIALVVPAIKRWADALVMGIAGVVAVLTAQFPLDSGLLTAVCIGIIVGMLIETTSKKRRTPDIERDNERAAYPLEPFSEHAGREQE